MITLIEFLVFIIGIGSVGYLMITEYKKDKRKRFIQLKREQEYPIVFVKEEDFDKIKTKTRTSASMTENSFTDIKTKEKINTEKYLGFVIFGNTDELGLFNGMHGDLIFVKKYFDTKKLPGEFVVISKNDNYIIKKVKKCKTNNKVILEKNNEAIEVTSIIGVIEFDFNIV